MSDDRDKSRAKILKDYKEFVKNGVPEKQAAVLTLTAVLHDAITFLAVAVSR